MPLLLSIETHFAKADTYQALQVVRKARVGGPCFPPLGSPRLGSQGPNLLNYPPSPRSAPVRTVKITCR